MKIVIILLERDKRLDQYYTKENLERLLRSDEISAEFRKRIETALNDGSQDAIESLGTVGLTKSGAEDLDKDKIASNNPQVDIELVDEALRLLGEASKMGIKPQGYKYVPPYQNTIFTSSTEKEGEA